MSDFGWHALGQLARVAKLADALDLGSSAERRAGSTPASRIARQQACFNARYRSGLARFGGSLGATGSSWDTVRTTDGDVFSGFC